MIQSFATREKYDLNYFKSIMVDCALNSTRQLLIRSE